MILHENETLPKAEMKDIQLARLQETVRNVYEKVPFYRDKFDQAAIQPSDIQTLADLKRLPFTKKTDLREHYPFGLMAVDQKDIVRIHASSGTSGKPTVVCYTKKDIDMWAELVARSIAIAGGQPGEIFHNAYGYGLFTGGLGLHYGAECLGMATVPVSGGNTERQISLIQDFNPAVIAGTPSYILNIIEKMETLGLDPADTSLKYGIFGAEPWSEEMRRTLEGKLGIKACDIYGLSEVMGPGISMECHEAQDGLHIADDHFIVEVIDPNTLEPVPDGEIGELVFTSLTKEALPIIRYRTGDLSSIQKGICKCGRTTTRMARIKGRIDDMLIIRGVNLFPSEIEHHLLKMAELAPYYQVHLHKSGVLDELALHVELSEEFYLSIGSDMNHPDILMLAKAIQHSMKNNCLVAMAIQILPPKSIPRSEGKAVRIIDKRAEGIQLETQG